jgi:hypothetical protein
MVEIIPALIIGRSRKYVKDQDGRNGRAFECRSRKGWLLARQKGRFGVVLLLAAAKMKYLAVVSPGFEAGLGTGARVGKRRLALIATGFCHLRQ